MSKTVCSPTLCYFSDHLVAVSCVTGAEADTLTHVTRAYRLPGGEPVVEQSDCRAPRIENQRLTCQAEVVDAQGELHLTPRVLMPER